MSEDIAIKIAFAMLGWLIMWATWITRKIFSADAAHKTFLTKDEHTAICEKKSERTTQLLEKIERKLEEQDKEAREQRHAVNDKLNAVDLKVAVLVARQVNKQDGV